LYFICSDDKIKHERPFFLYSGKILEDLSYAKTVLISCKSKLRYIPKLYDYVIATSSSASGRCFLGLGVPKNTAFWFFCANIKNSIYIFTDKTFHPGLILFNAS
jgi:hypothetical protein